MPATPWSSAVARVNRLLEAEGLRLRGQPVKLKVRHKPREDGSRAIDIVANFNAAQSPSTRFSGVTLSPGNYEIRLEEARSAAPRLVKRASEGEDTRAPRGRPGPLLDSTGALARQIEEARRYLLHRSQHLGRCRPRQLRTQLQWLAISEGRAQRKGAELSMPLCLEALRDHYGGVSRKAYADAAALMRLVCGRLDLPTRIPDELVPTYRYEPQLRSDIPPDELISERLKAIDDPYQAQLVYSVVVYGRRVAEIYYADWSQLAPDGDLPVFSSKTRKRATSWPMPFGDEQICLTEFRPPRWEKLASIDRVPPPEVEEQIRVQASSISRLIKTTLGCTATDLRHRWGAACLTNPEVHEDAYEIAAAMLTSIAMLEKTYTREMREYRKQRKASHSSQL